jgi:phosphatidylglycerophosphate synthase
MQDPSAQPIIEVNSRLEPLVIAKICQPALRLVPLSVPPNAITLFNAGVVWTSFLLAAVATELQPGAALIFRVIAGFGVFAAMVLDCLDGMQARRTNRCSRVGEFLDHWLDALTMPLTAGALILTLELDVWSTTAAIVTTGMVFNAQLVLQHHTGRFVGPPTAGLDAQLMLSVSFVALAVVLYFVPRDTAWLTLGLTAFAWAAAVGGVRNCLFFYRLLGRQALDHFKYVALCLAFGALYWLGLMSDTAYVILVAFVGFRISGSTVLATLTGQRYHGWDWTAAGWVAVIAAVGALLDDPVALYGYHVQDYLPYLACLHLGAANLVDLTRQYAILRDGAATLSPRSPRSHHAPPGG